MKLKVARLFDNGDSSLGIFSINGKPEAFTVEDEKRDIKVKKETRIPEGTYEVKLRTEGTHHEHYKKKYGAKHFGMLHIVNIPNFQFVLIHIGNSDEDTEGCLLPGLTADLSTMTIGSSTVAYEKIYNIIAPELVAGGTVFIEFIDVQTTLLK